MPHNESLDTALAEQDSLEAGQSAEAGDHAAESPAASRRPEETLPAAVQDGRPVSAKIRAATGKELVPESGLPFASLGHFQIVARLGHGGMGDVYLGYEPALDRKVAIKVLPPELARQEDFVRRFRAEATAVARLTNPNVVQIHFIGEDQGHYFFAMQYVEGESLAEMLARRGRLKPDETLAIVEQMLAGLAAAHKQGIVHRDIKPANILLDRENHRALLADFGLVKSVAAGAKMTATGIVMGTVDYISPEQGRGQPVDARSDLYSVGVLMYHMLSGNLPFEADSPTAMIFQHVYEQPKPLHEVATQVPAALCAVVHKLMAKSPDQRHQTADEVLADLRALRTAHPAAKPAAAAGRRQTVIIEAPRFDEALPISADIEAEASVPWWRRTRDRWLDQLRRRSPELVKRLQNTQQQVDGAVAEYEQRRNSLQALVGDADQVVAELKRQAADHREAAAAAARRAEALDAEADIRDALEEKAACEKAADDLARQTAEQEEQLDTMRLRLAQVNATLQRVRSQRDALAARLKVAQVRIQLAAGRPQRRPLATAVRIVAVVAAGTLILAAALIFWPGKLSFLAWIGTPRPATDASAGPSGKQPAGPAGGPGQNVVTGNSIPQQLAFLPDGSGFAAVNQDASITLYQFRDDGGVQMASQQLGQLRNENRITFSPDGRLFATAGNDTIIRIWETGGDPRRKELRRLQGHTKPASQLVFSRDGSQLLSASVDRTLRLWDVATETEIRQSNVQGVRNDVSTMDWSRDGARVLIGARLHGGPSMSIWNLFDDIEETVFDTNKDLSISVAFSSAEDHVFALHSGFVAVYDVKTGQAIRKMGEDLRSVAFSPAAYRAWAASKTGSLSLWDLRGGTVIQTFSGDGQAVSAIALSVDGTRALAAGSKGTLRAWELPQPPPPANQLLVMPGNAPVTCVAFSPDGAFAVCNGRDDLYLWNAADGAQVRTFAIQTPVASAAYSPDARTIIYGTGGKTSKLGNIAIREVTNRSGRDERRFQGHVGQVTAVALTPDLQRAVSASRDGTVRVWNVPLEQESKKLEVGLPVHCLALTKAENEVLIGADDRSIRLWKWDAGQDVKRLEGHTSAVLGIAVSADGQRAASASADQAVCVWDLPAGKSIARLEGHSGPVNSVAISQHGLTVLSGSDDGTVRLWDVPTAKEVLRFEGHVGPVRSVALSADGLRALSGGDDATLRVWKLPIRVQ